MSGKTKIIKMFVASVFVLCAQQSLAQTVNLNAPNILGKLKLPAEEMKTIQDSVEKAMTSPIDQEFQCGKVYMDCVVRAAREWTYEGNTFREIVVNVHTIGHASFTVEKPKSESWPKIAVN